MAFHYVARGLIRDGGHILLVRAIGDNMTFLPGGHIEFGESAPVALARELFEEASINANVGAFIGAAENEWFLNGQPQAEINLLFEVETGLSHRNPIASNEAYLEFFWVPCKDIEYWNLFPESLRQLVKQNRLPKQAFWGTGISLKSE
ncbi:NUDIX domain-containing protein [Photobacterium gaetbulicola]|uniref:Putative MutT/nudix family protein n=1 Tax=Photobacterium gaetbulicola Gung47 TaxID=658445 RepID=A0A0C5WU31_9GAMM|nr:NUDIX domain-containing protein [Photobacterium gaetbulicola]AJR06565.1 putative MutT/nudix family protein [Photobacterium gaetbulicola Gung47]PSU13895.1 NUDIX domain-containing protein [Photobacterium gaetbulicola]